MAASTARPSVAMIALSEIRHDRNVKQALAPSESTPWLSPSPYWDS
jgi:hypothetical protein